MAHPRPLGSVAQDIILLFRDGPDLAHDLGIKEDGRDVRVTGPFLCFSIMTSKLLLQPLHGAATVQDEYQFRQILLHEKSPYTVLFGLQAQYRGIFVFSGRLAGDKSHRSVRHQTK